MISSTKNTYWKLDMETRHIISVSFILYIIIPTSEANVNCTVSWTSYSCIHIARNTYVPLILTAGFEKVTLIGTYYPLDSFFRGLFDHQTWVNVSELSVFEFNKVRRIEKDFLYGLRQLKYLSISSCRDLVYIDPDLFYSTPDLEALHLDENHSLKITMLEAALSGKLSKLKYLSLIGIQNIHHHIVLGGNFFHALNGKDLIYFDISGTNMIYVEHVIVQEIFASVKYLNISYSTIVLPPGMKDQLVSVMNSIELLDLTGSQYMMRPIIIQGDELIDWDFLTYGMYLFVQGVMTPHTHIRLNVNYTFQKCELKGPKMLDLSKNNLIILNITISGECIWPALETLNLASNNMEYISPSILSRFPSLKIIDLSMNQLHKMQTMDDFSYIFSRNIDLEIIFLRNNYLSVIPLQLFSSNTKLRLIDLSENELTYFNIELHNTWDLKLLDLRKNRLKNLPPVFVGQLEQIFLHRDTTNKHNITMTNSLISQFNNINLIGQKYKYGYNSSGNEEFKELLGIIPQHITVNILENPIKCDCDMLDFVKWILITDIIIVNRTALLCKQGNTEELLDNAVFEKVTENCRLASIIGIGIATSVAIILCVFTIAMMIRLRRRKARENQDFDDLKRELTQDNTMFNFIAFVSYCSQDQLIVEGNILPSLNKYLKERLDTEKDLVCTGADSFVPGMLIIEEIHRCINESLVIVPVITPEFLESRWSLKECVDAIEKHRQAVVLMKQHTDTFTTIGTIKHLITHYTRATWSEDEGHFIIHPSWNTICDGIIRMATETFRNNRRQKFNSPVESIPLVE